MIRVTEARQTCGACPSQWEGRTDDGRHIYARYRWGHLSVGVGPTLDDAVMADMYDSKGEEVYSGQHGDDLDGSMSASELADATRHVIRWPWDTDGAR